MKTVEAGKVRKGTLILIEGKVGPRLVTKREKWNKTYCRVYYAEPVIHFTNPPGLGWIGFGDFWRLSANCFRLDHVLKIYDPACATVA